LTSHSFRDHIGGFCDPRFAAVRDAFAANIAGTENIDTENIGTQDTGAAVAVYHRGKLVVDLWGGAFDRERTTPYARDTLQLVFSTTKGVVATAIAMCVERGLFSYEDTVASIWPEFAANGKHNATVRQLLSHQCALHTLDPLPTRDEVCDWNLMVKRLSSSAPKWEIGSRHGYHAITFGWLAGELVRCTDGRNVGKFVAEEIAGPLGVEFYIGLPEHLEPRVSKIIAPDTSTMTSAERKHASLAMGPGTVGSESLFSGVLDRQGGFNRRDLHAAEIPAANGITSARDVAKIYAATLCEIDGVRLIADVTREIATKPVTPIGEPDACLIEETRFGMGYMTHSPATPYSGAGCFGHPGAGGSVAFADPSREMSFAYVMNAMGGALLGTQRATRLTTAAARCADSL